MQQPNPHRRAAILLIALAPAITMAAGWSGVWPSQDYQRETYRQISECYSGILERASLNALHTPTAPTWYRSNRANLIALKSDYKTLLTYGTWVSTNGIETTTSAAAFLNDTGRTAFPLWGASPYAAFTNICNVLRMPTNYLDYTPYRSLTGVGGFTNDTSVDYPHGFTNASTALGGSYYPAGRSVWYTTDYGWARFPDLLNCLTATRVTPTMYSVGMVWQPSAPGYRSSWAAATAAADANGTPGSDGTFFYGNGTYGLVTFFGDYYANAQAFSNYFAHTTAFASTLLRKFEVYAKALKLGFVNESPSPSLDTFDALGTVLVDSTYVYVVDNDSTTNAYTLNWGSTNIPTWCDSPTYGNNSYRGWSLYQGGPGGTYPSAGLIRWNITGGFKFY